MKLLDGDKIGRDNKRVTIYFVFSLLGILLLACGIGIGAVLVRLSDTSRDTGGRHSAALHPVSKRWIIDNGWQAVMRYFYESRPLWLSPGTYFIPDAGRRRFFALTVKTSANGSINTLILAGPGHRHPFALTYIRDTPEYGIPEIIINSGYKFRPLIDMGINGRFTVKYNSHEYIKVNHIWIKVLGSRKSGEMLTKGHIYAWDIHRGAWVPVGSSGRKKGRCQRHNCIRR